MEKKIIAEQLLKLAKTLIAAEEPEELEEEVEEKKADEDDEVEVDKSKIATSLLKLAKLLVAEEEEGDELSTLLKKQDPTLTSVVNKINAVVGDDLSRLLTVVLMVMRKNKHNQEASQLFNLFKPVLKRVAK